MLLGDADVEHPLREPLRELAEPDRQHHRRADAHHVRPLGPDRAHLLAEDLGPASLRRLARRPGLRVHDTDRVHPVRLVALGGAEAAALRRDHVHQRRPVHRRRLAQRLLGRGDVVAVDRADVGQTEVGEQVLRTALLARSPPRWVAMPPIVGA